MKANRGRTEKCNMFDCVTFMHCTVFALQGSLYEVSCRFEVLTEVKAVRVLRWDAKVKAGVPVKTLVADAALLGVRCI